MTCTVSWEISNKCNYSCWYCPSRLHSGTSGWPDFQKSLDFFNFLSQKNEYVYITMMGGEPTLWPKLTEFLQKLPKNVFAEVTTNGSRTMAWWEKTKPYLDKVVFSFHANSAKEEHVFSVAKMLKISGIETHVLLLFDPACEDRLYEFAKKLKKEEIEYQFKAIFPNFGPKMIDYTEKQKETIIKDRFFLKSGEKIKPKKIIINNSTTVTASEIVIENAHKFYGFSCMAGSKRLHISCDQEIFAGSCLSKKLGTLNEPNLANRPIICPKQSCHCLDDVIVTKWRNA
jgi:organic radical activating enzyme